MMKSFISDPEQVRITFFNHTDIHTWIFEYILWCDILWSLSGSGGARSPQKRGHCCQTPIQGFENQPIWQISKSFQYQWIFYLNLNFWLSWTQWVFHIKWHNVDEKLCIQSVSVLAEACSGPCNRSCCEAGSWGWLEDMSPPRRLLVPLWRPHLAQDQFWTTWAHGGCRLVMGAVWL